jgi:hypothetical protein
MRMSIVNGTTRLRRMGCANNAFLRHSPGYYLRVLLRLRHGYKCARVWALGCAVGGGSSSERLLIAGGRPWGIAVAAPASSDMI